MYRRAIYVHLTTTRDRSVTLDINVWKAAHDLALEHGWQPMGASPPPGWHGFRDQPDWLGDYVWPPALAKVRHTFDESVHMSVSLASAPTAV